MTFTVYNPKSYPISMSSIGYDVTMNGLAVGEGASERSVTIPPGETRTIETTTVIRNQLLDEWWVSHLERNQVTDLEIQFYARFDLSAASAGEVRVPLDSVTHTIETDMFRNKDEYPTGESDEENAGESGGGDGGESTPTETPTETETPTGDDPTATESDGESLSGGDDTETATPTQTATDTGSETPTDDGDDGVLGV
jgi:hypothetical protein